MKIRTATLFGLLLPSFLLLEACSSTAAGPGGGGAGGPAVQAGGGGAGPAAGTGGGAAGTAPMGVPGGAGGMAPGGGAAGTPGTAGAGLGDAGMGGAPLSGAGTGGMSAGGAETGGEAAGGAPVFAGEPMNVSTGKTCVSSANFTANLPCELALDGVVSQESRWESEQGVDDGWMYVDLGATYAVSEIDIYWEHSGALVHEAQVWTKYDMEPTDVDADWTAVAREENLANHQHLDLIESLYPIDPVVTRYVRIRCFVRMWEWGNSIFELDVLGVPATP